MVILCSIRNIQEINVQIYILDSRNTTNKENIHYLRPFLLVAFLDLVAVTVTRGIVTVGAAVTFGILVAISVALLVSAEIEAPTLSLSEASFIVTATSCCLSDVAFSLPTKINVY